MTDSTAEVSIIIVSFNTREMTVACIRSIVSQSKGHSYEILVIDNNSRDGSAEAIKEEFPQVNLIRRSDNLGFAAANNLAAKHAKGTRLLLLNPDTLVLDGAIDTIVSFADRTPTARLWGGRAVFPDGSLNVSCWSDMTIWSCLCRAVGLTWMLPKSKLFNPESIHLWDPLNKERGVDIVVGCFLLIDKSLWDELGGFNRTFFMYGDEVDLCIRARKKGARPRFTPDAVIIHYGGGSEPSSEEKLIKVFKGRITVMKEHWLPLVARLGQWTLVATAGLRAIGSSVLRPPSRRGAGLDQRSDVWPAVFRRRKEWFGGWDTTKGND
jgi:GT2 family glycosyltransferase